MLTIPKAGRRQRRMPADAVIEPAPPHGPRRSRHRSLLFASPVLLLVLPAVATTQSSSNASNFSPTAHVSVSPRTGGLTVQAELFRVRGVLDTISAALTLTYQSDVVVSNLPSENMPAGRRFLDVPIGWSMNLSYISDNGAYKDVNIDDGQSYALDADWRTRFTPAGSTTAFLIPIGMRQYSRVDANLQIDSGTVTVHGIPSAFVLANLDGKVRYLSEGGLLLEERDPFGNSIQYQYHTQTGQAATQFTSPEQTLLSSIMDS